MKRKIFLALLLSMVLTGFHTIAQPGLPVVSVQFAGAVYDCNSQTYLVNVEFKSDVPGIQVFGMNVRFFYDDNILEFMSMEGFETGYGSPLPSPLPENYGPGSGASFGLSGPLEFVNGIMQLFSPSPVILTTDSWTRLLSIRFHVDDPEAISIASFCPSIIWDLRENPAEGGYGPGDEGVVISVVDPSPQVESSPSIENVMQYNWAYGGVGNIFGSPVEEYCISTICGTVIPVSNWSLFLAIGLMLVASLYIWRRRLNA